MGKTYIAICATAALGLCLMAPKDASALPAADGAGKGLSAVAGKSAVTQVRYVAPRRCCRLSQRHRLSPYRLWRGTSPLWLRLWPGTSPLWLRLWPGTSPLWLRLWPGISPLWLRLWPGISPLWLRLWPGISPLWLWRRFRRRRGGLRLWPCSLCPTRHLVLHVRMELVRELARLCMWLLLIAGFSFF